MTAWMLALLLAGCSSGDGEGARCANHSDCGDGQACVEERCRAVECIDSEQCDIGRYCGDDFACHDGCETDDDCLAGERCDVEAHACEAAECRDTQLDCATGQFCDPTTGQCYDADGPYCESCDVGGASCGAGNECYPFERGQECDAANGDRDCPAGEGCYVTELGDECDPFRGDRDCGSGFHCDAFDTDGDGWPEYLCHRDYCYSGRCLVACDASDPDSCPRGYQCTQVWSDDPKTYCYADCTWLDENGYLGGRSARGARATAE